MYKKKNLDKQREKELKRRKVRKRR